MINLFAIDVALLKCLEQKLGPDHNGKITLGNRPAFEAGCYSVAVNGEEFSECWPAIRKFDAVIHVTGKDITDMMCRMDYLAQQLKNRELMPTEFGFSLSLVKTRSEIGDVTGKIMFSLSAFVPDAAGFPQIKVQTK